MSPMRGLYPAYSVLVGYTGLLVEATLPLPQIFANARSRSCKGFRLSVLASWLLGDAMKMLWFFTSTTRIPWAFKLCGIFQAGFDLFLGLQYLMYGDGQTSIFKDHQMTAGMALMWRALKPSECSVPSVQRRPSLFPARLSSE